MMKVIKFWLSTFCRKLNGNASIDWRTVSIVPVAFLPSAFSIRFLAVSRPPTAADQVFRIDVGELHDHRVLLFAADAAHLAISIETASICLGSSLAIRPPACSCGRLISSTAALRRSCADTIGTFRKWRVPTNRPRRPAPPGVRFRLRSSSTSLSMSRRLVVCRWANRNAQAMRQTWLGHGLNGGPVICGQGQNWHSEKCDSQNGHGNCEAGAVPWRPRGCSGGAQRPLLLSATETAQLE